MSAINLFELNQQVTACQDEAFTLAWYLSGDDQAAEAAVQAAVEAVFQNHSQRKMPCRLAILGAVIDWFRQGSHLRWQGRQPLPITGANDAYTVLSNLRRLPEAERLALILVDILGLGYPEAAGLASLPVKTFGQRLAQARRSLAAVA